ncbi:MAG: integration host factor subunit beta [Magnetococcales bacterium]|nr:integration host factor subunit beta [Magnetococcales bacterium]MBF0117149.1 integration host factor subunit beta [Magnetococcales bacterium]
MTKSELINQIAKQCNLTRKDAQAVVEIMCESIALSLEHGHRVELRGFGSFGLKQRQSRAGRNPKTGEQVSVEAKRVMFFKPGQEMRRRVDGEGDQQ